MDTEGITIEWAAHATPATIEDVCIDHGGGQIAVSEQLLHRTDILAVF